MEWSFFKVSLIVVKNELLFEVELEISQYGNQLRHFRRYLPSAWMWINSRNLGSIICSSNPIRARVQKAASFNPKYHGICCLVICK